MGNLIGLAVVMFLIIIALGISCYFDPGHDDK